MPQHNFLFHPSKEELPNYIAAIEKVEAQDQFRGQVAVDLQLHQGQWTGELSALTSRKMMAFITEIYMELPPEAAKEDEEFDIVSDGPFAPEEAQPESGTDDSESTEQSSSDDEDEEDDDEEEPYTENHASNFPEDNGQTAEQRKAKKLVKPKSVTKTGNAAITVEED